MWGDHLFQFCVGDLVGVVWAAEFFKRAVLGLQNSFDRIAALVGRHSYDFFLTLYLVTFVRPFHVISIVLPLQLQRWPLPCQFHGRIFYLWRNDQPLLLVEPLVPWCWSHYTFELAVLWVFARRSDALKQKKTLSTLSFSTLSLSTLKCSIFIFLTLGNPTLTFLNFRRPNF